MPTQNVGPSQQGVNLNSFDIGITETASSKQTNIDLAVQLVFLEDNKLMNLRTQDKLNEVKATLDEMNACRDMYSRMKELQQQAKQNGTSTMPQDMVDFINARGIKYDTTGNDNVHNHDEWDVNMQYLDSYMQKISGQNKTQMLELNQFVEAGNNALREVSTVFSKFSEIIQSIIQTINR